MNSDTYIGTSKNVTGQIKEVTGKAIGDEQMQGSGIADQFSGNIQNAYGKARDFARDRPLATAAVAGIIGLAILNTLRGN
ncbi:CsbD family protein [Sphingomonas sp. BIUV-7]|uniref:CsbD family protein n=1 Tax=Sphingomonas natans TaxID=3063330 RepID=A0ABT8Y779_9SPHN|nr:CsbD family protein [Sphingomonas sp. BIUV-7]MDO6414173.1 CsbD family protein [Sphingomonas sp. BIUV-7]